MDGGILWAVERVILITLGADALMSEAASKLHEGRHYRSFALPGEDEGGQQRSDGGGKLNHARLTFRELATGNLRSVRLALLSYIQTVTQPDVLELRTLQGYLASAAELDSRVAALERYGEAIDGELRSVAALRVNFLALLVAVAALVLSIVVATVRA
jgi:hypothetical protein